MGFTFYVLYFFNVHAWANLKKVHFRLLFHRFNNSKEIFPNSIWVGFVLYFAFSFFIFSLSLKFCLLRSSIARALPKARVPKPSPASVAATKLSGTTTNSGCCPLLLSQLFYFITDSMWVWGLGFLTPKNFINKPPNWWLLFIQWRLMKIKIYCWYSKSH